MSERIRWWLWSLLSDLPRVCPAQLHSVLVWQEPRRSVGSATCRGDRAACGSCWCGKYRDPERVA